MTQEMTREIVQALPSLYPLQPVEEEAILILLNDNVSEKDSEMGDHDKKSRCEQCEYFGKASDAPETVEEDCMWQTCEDENCTLPCEKGAGMERLTSSEKEIIGD